MTGFDTTAYGPVMGPLLEGPRLNDLGPDAPKISMQSQLEPLTGGDAFAHTTVRDEEMATACLSALWLLHDFLDRSHTLSQSLPSTTGSYWHGIMHRREPDAWNSGYWFRRVGKHPIFDELRVAAAEQAGSVELDESVSFLAGQAVWDPFAFIDLCEASRGGGTPIEALCREIQRREWELLFDYSYRQAIGQ